METWMSQNLSRGSDTLDITRQEIGRIAGCSREMAGRVLKELEAKGLITAHGKTIVVFGTR